MNARLSAVSWLVLGLMTLGLLLLALGGYLTPLTRLLEGPAVNAQTWLATRVQAVRDLLTEPRDVQALRQRNAELEAQVAQLEGQILAMQQQLAQMEVLSALLNFSRAHPENRYLAAQVIGRDPSPFLHYILINRGSDDGLRRGMPVVSAEGLVGRVTAVTASAARVQLITDPAMRVNVKVQPSGAEGLVLGSATGEISLDQVSLEASIQPGDVVVTSGLGGLFPPNIVVGQITGVRRLEFELFQRASVQPVVNFARLEIVLVITNFRPVDVSPLLPTPVP